MTAHLDVDPATGQTVVTFELPDDAHDGPVSVVGSFNHWTPGVDVLQPKETADAQ